MTLSSSNLSQREKTILQLDRAGGVYGVDATQAEKATPVGDSHNSYCLGKLLERYSGHLWWIIKTVSSVCQ